MSAPIASDTFTNAAGQCFIAGVEVPPEAYKRHVTILEHASQAVEEYQALPAGQPTEDQINSFWGAMDSLAGAVGMHPDSR